MHRSKRAGNQGSLISVAALMCLWAFVGCSKKPTLIAVFPRTTGTLLWENFHVGIEQAAQGKNVRIYWNAPPDESDTGGQLDLVDGYSARSYQGMIWAPIDTMASRSVILEATQDKIPLVLVDAIEGPSPNHYLSYVSSDEHRAGQLAAEYLAKILKGRGSVAVIGISGRLASANARQGAFEDALAKIAPGIEIQSRHYGDFSVTHQQQIVQTILSQAHVDAIVALSATSTEGAFYAKLASAPRSHVALIGFDQDMLVPLETGDIDAVVAQDTLQIGKRAMFNLLSEIEDQSAPGFTSVPPILVTRENLHSAQVVTLWNTHIQNGHQR